MEEIIEQYNASRKYLREMFFTMLLMFAIAVVMLIIGFVIRDLLLLFLIFGTIMAVFGALVYIPARVIFKKADKAVRKYLALNGKSQQEIESLLGADK